MSVFDRTIFDAEIFDVGDGPSPLAGLSQSRPMTATQGYPLTTHQSAPLKTTQRYPLAGVKQTYPLGGN